MTNSEIISVHQLTSTLFNPRRDHDRWDPYTQAVKCEEEGFWADYPIRAWDTLYWCWNMIKEATMLIVGDDEQGFIPLRAGANGFIDLLDKQLPLVDIMGWVIISRRFILLVHISLLNDNIVGKRTFTCMFLEFLFIRVEFRDKFELPKIAIEKSGRHILVVYSKREICIINIFKYCSLWIPDCQLAA